MIAVFFDLDFLLENRFGFLLELIFLLVIYFGLMYFHCIPCTSYLDLLSCLVPLGLVFGSLCFMAPGSRRSRSPRRPVAEEVHGLVLRLPYDPLNPYDPPLTVYTEHRFPDLPPLPSRPPTSPISSRDHPSMSHSPAPSTRRANTLPPLQRRRRHLREPSVEAPIIITPSVTLEEAPHPARPPSSAAAHPARDTPSSLDSDDTAPGTQRQPPVRTPPVPPPPAGTTPKARAWPSTPAPSKPVTIKVPHRRSQSDSAITRKSIQASSRPISKKISKSPIASTSRPTRAKASAPAAVVESSEYTYVTASSSDDESSDTRPPDAPKKNPLVLQPDSVPSLQNMDQLELQARVLMSKASDSSISPKQFNDFLTKLNLRIFNPDLCTEDSTFRCLAIVGPPKAGKSTLGSAMNVFIQGTPQTTTSKKFYKWINEKQNVNMFHYSNDSFASSDGIDWGRFLQSVNSTQFQPGRHFIIIEGHRLYENEAIMKLSHNVVFLTGTPYTLRNRQNPTPETSLQLYCDRIRPLLAEINSSKNILKLDARNSQEMMVKKVGAFLAMSNLGYQHCGRKMSDTKVLLELSEEG